MRISSKLLVAGAAAALVATGGTAFTASNTLNGNNVAGYGTANTSGATTEVIEHTLSADGTKIISTSLTFTTDLFDHHQVQAQFGTAALQDCVETILVAGTGTGQGKDTAVCTYATQPDTSTATTFKVTVS